MPIIITVLLVIIQCHHCCYPRYMNGDIIIQKGKVTCLKLFFKFSDNMIIIFSLNILMKRNLLPRIYSVQREKMD